ncbi:MAG: aminotransferase class I/II-fold pyridoxal phosphate-dependent enzyme [Myroides sp.]
MARINHNDPLETINDSIERAKAFKVLHQYAEGNFLKGDRLTVDGAQLIHFATTGYLKLEQDERLKDAAADAAKNFGTQFPLSKTYISHPLYAELEELLKQMYDGQSPVVTKNSTLAHIGVIPHTVGYEDAVILDHQVHWSVQSACQNLKLRDIPIHMIRHNNMEQLEELLAGFKNRYRKVWYMADGIYSMYGDCAPVSKLKELMEKYKNLYLYFDDVHGMSWTGLNGTGFIRSHWPVIPERIVLVSTLSKSFGASGAFVLSGDTALMDKIKNFGGPLTFSAQLEPSAVAAAIASAKIHLSHEISDLQNILQNKIKAFHRALLACNIPLMSDGVTPVFYIPVGLPKTAYVLTRKLARERFYVNAALFPAVPINKAGLRITISIYTEYKEIERLAKALESIFPKALVETGNTYEKINRIFKTDFKAREELLPLKPDLFKTSAYDSIEELDEDLWNKLLDDNAFDYKGVQFIQNYFSGLDKSNPNHMDFRYYTVSDAEAKVVALTYTSSSLWKEDMLSHTSVSEKIEQIRLTDPDFLTEKVMSTGSVFSEGNHTYIEKDIKEVRMLQWAFFQAVEYDFEKGSSQKLVLRDFRRNGYLGAVSHSRGYLVIEMPHSAVFCDFNWDDIDGFEQVLSKRSRRHFRSEVLPHVDDYDVTVLSELDASELEKAVGLYRLLKSNNLDINNFDYDYSLFEAMNKSPLWQFLILRKKGSDEIAGVMFCYINKSNNSFNPVLIGMQPQPEGRLDLYRQMLFQTIWYARKQNYSKVYLGVSAIFEKKKLGAVVCYNEAYVRMKDQYSSDLLHTFE